MSPEENTRFAVFSLAYYPLEGGAEVATREIISRLPDKRFFVFTKKFNSVWPRRESFGNGEIIRIGRGKTSVDYYGRPLSKLFFVFRAYLAANREHKKEKFKAVWAIMASYSGLAALLFKLRHPSVPFLLTLQEGDSEEYIMDRVGIFYFAWRMIFKRADYISVISKYLGDFARRHGARCPVEVVPNGITVGNFQFPISNFQKKSKIQNSNVKTIITTSRLVYKNGVDILIRAVSQLPITDYHLLIVGGGPKEENLKELAKRLGVEDKIEFLGQVPAKEIPEYLSRADIFVRASRSEGLGSSFLEAMAAGLPVIGTPVGGIIDFLKSSDPNDTNLNPNDPNGFFVKVDDPSDLAEKINLLLNNDTLRKSLGENGRKLVLESYSWDSIASKINKILQSLVVSRLSLVKNIVFAAGIYPPDVGGPALHTKELAERFKEKGIKVAVVSYGEAPGMVSRKFSRSKRYSLYFWKILKAARGADLIYAQDATATGLPAMFASKILKKPLYLRIGGDVLWERAVEHGERFFSLKDYYSQGFHLQDRQKMFGSIKKVFKSAKAIVVTTPLLKEIYVKFYNLPPEKIKVILNPLPPFHPELDSGSRNKLSMDSGFRRNDKFGLDSGWSLPRAATLGRNDKSEIILFAGRFVAYKNLEFLMRAFDKIRQKISKGELVLIGDGPEKENLEKLKAKLSSREKIKILARLGKEKIYENIRDARVCIGPALTEFNPNFILECLSLNTPALISRENGLTVQLPSDFQFDPKDTEDLENKLERVFQEDFYTEAKEMVSKIDIKQSWEDVVREHLEFFGIFKS